MLDYYSIIYNFLLLFYFQGDSNSAGQRLLNRTGSQSAGPGSYVLRGMPRINPMEFAIQKKREEDANLQRVISQAKARYTTEEMRKVDLRSKSLLFDGFTREGKGRYQYLQRRHNTIPEKKYTFPVLSSWEYGWRLDETDGPRKPPHARTKLITDTFYTRSGVPTLQDPTKRPNFDRTYTVV